MIRTGRARWAMSFADLCLLLLGFFVLLQASRTQRDAALAGLNAYFARIEAPRSVDLAADALFQPGEALLSDEGRALLARRLAPLVGKGESVRVQSFGTARDTRRFDGWDLAAARLGAIARAVRAMGLPEDRITIAGLAETEESPRGQTIRIVADQPRP